MYSNLLKVVFVTALLAGVANAGWVRARTGTLAWLHDVQFMDENRGVAAGGSGVYLETSDGGKSWQKRTSFTTDNIRQIFFAGSSNGWLLCERDVYNRGGSAVSYLLRTKDGGANWDKIEFEDLGRSRITRIFFNSEGRGFAVGESGSIYTEGENGKWAKSPSAIRYLLLDGEFFGRNGALVGAAGSIYFTEDDGATWTAANVFGDKSSKLGSIFMYDRRNGWAVGSGGKVFQTTSGGRTWREQASGVTTDLGDVAFRSTAEGWTVGDNGVILHTQTGGNVWSAEDSGVKHKLERLALAGKRPVVAGFGGTILYYDQNARPEQNTTKPVIMRRN